MAHGVTAQEIHYIYDKLGRLIGVVDTQGRTAIYEYDPVGNLLAIRRQDATGPVAITLVNPDRGTVGTRVEIFGIGFSPVAANNQVAFNGVAATVATAANNSLTTSVPTGAASGPITVTTPLGSAVSATPFTVLAVSRFDISADFSTTANPNGVWSYGFSRTLGGVLTLYDLPSVALGSVQVWRSSIVQSAGAPTDINNPTGGAIQTCPGCIPLPGHTAAFHPGPNGEFSVFRFTAPSAGTSSLSATFVGIDHGGTDVHILHNGREIFSANITGGSTSTFSQSVSLMSGDVIDFAVGVGTDGNFLFDSTSINASITLTR